MSPQDLRRLIEKWRKEATDSLERWPRGAILPAKKLRACADELDALLVAGSATPQQEKVTGTCPQCGLGITVVVSSRAEEEPASHAR